MNIKNVSFINSKTLNILVLVYPLTLTTGNLLINLNIILVCVLGVLVYKKNIFNFNQFKSIFLIFLFFISIIIITGLNLKSIENQDGFLKSFFYLRYFIFLIVLRSMIKNNHLNIKQLLICCLLVTLFISLDATFQAITGKNFFGLEGFERHNPSIFGEEKISGSYIQRFYLFALICLPFIFNKLDNKKLIIICLLLLIFFSGVLFSGNRMPLIMFAFSIGLIIFLIKELRLTLLIGCLFCSLIFILLVSTNKNMKKHYTSFYYQSVKTVLDLKKFSTKKYPELENQKDKYFVKEIDIGKDNKKLREKYEIIMFWSGHQVVFLTAIDVWTDNIFWGNGLKSFRITCWTKLHLPNRVCESHPHNYYLELLNDTGLIGTLIFIFGIFFIIRKKFINFKYYEKNEKLLFICLLIIIIAEFFPLKSSGSFFSTTNSSFIFLILGMLNGLKKIKE